MPSQGAWLRREGRMTSVFSDFRRACPGRNHNWPATGEGENPFPLSFRLAQRVGRKVREQRLCGSRSVVAPLGQAQRKRKAGRNDPNIKYRSYSSHDPSRGLPLTRKFVESVSDSRTPSDVLNVVQVEQFQEWLEFGLRAEYAEGPFFDLPHGFPRHVEQLSHLDQRPAAAVDQSVPQLQDFPFTWLQVRQHGGNFLSQSLSTYVLQRVLGMWVGQQFAQASAFCVWGGRIERVGWTI